MFRNRKLSALVVLSLLFLAGSCKKEYDVPPLTEIPETPTMTIAELRAWQAGTGGIISIDEELSVYGTITMDETDGNIYKNVYLQDASGAVNVRLLNGGGLYEGDSVRIYLKGTILNKYNGVLQIDSVDVDQNVIKQETNVGLAPNLVTIDMITSLMESQLIRLENVQFIKPQLGGTFADGENLVSLDRILEDADGNTVKVRTSGYAAFADEQLPSGSGSLVCIVNHFNGEVQLLIRSYDEINFNEARFPGLLMTKDFDDGDIYSDGWMTYNVLGDVPWSTSSAGGAPNDYAVIKNYIDGAFMACETWLISPSIDLTAGESPTLSFDNAYNYVGPTLQLMISTDYDGASNPAEQGTWTAVAFTKSDLGGFVWVNSGAIPLGAFIGTNVHIAFKYTGTASSGSTWEVENIAVRG